jgi:hypothetical protein
LRKVFTSAFDDADHRLGVRQMRGGEPEEGPKSRGEGDVIEFFETETRNVRSPDGRIPSPGCASGRAPRSRIAGGAD